MFFHVEAQQNVPEPLAVACNFTPELGASWSQERKKKNASLCGLDDTCAETQLNRSVLAFFYALRCVLPDLCETADPCALFALYGYIIDLSPPN